MSHVPVQRVVVTTHLHAVCSALELASKSIVGGSVKLTCVLVFMRPPCLKQCFSALPSSTHFSCTWLNSHRKYISPLLNSGFGLTIGSDLYLLVDHHARDRLLATVHPDIITIQGRFMGTNSTQIPNFAGSFVFTNATAAALPTNIIAGCYRDPSWPWYLRPFPFWTLFIMVPAFSILSSMANGQPLKSRQLPVMVIISCASFAGAQGQVSSGIS